MSRPLRIEYPGAWYHVLNRGRRKEKIFFDDSGYCYFLNILGECSRFFNLEVHAYSLMPNHYHLLIHTPNGNLSRIMRHIDGVHTQKTNRKYGFEGSLFKGRFKSIVIEETNYLLELVRYIHRNPLKANLEEQLGEHVWTSHRSYMMKKYKPRWLHIDHVLRKFSEYEKEAKREFHAFVNKEPPVELERRLDGKNWPALLGGKHFKKLLKEKLLGEKINEQEIPQYKENIKKMDINEFSKTLIHHFSIKDDFLIQKGRRDAKISNLKRGFIFVCREYLQASNRETQTILNNISLSSINKQYHIAKKEIEKKEGCYLCAKKMIHLLK